MQPNLENKRSPDQTTNEIWQDIRESKRTGSYDRTAKFHYKEIQFLEGLLQNFGVSMRNSIHFFISRCCREKILIDCNLNNLMNQNME
jgi:hypothetical protein